MQRCQRDSLSGTPSEPPPTARGVNLPLRPGGPVGSSDHDRRLCQSTSLRLPPPARAAGPGPAARLRASGRAVSVRAEIIGCLRLLRLQFSLVGSQY
eukprot:745729-Hanusia_phi.AAC.5